MAWLSKLLCTDLLEKHILSSSWKWQLETKQCLPASVKSRALMPRTIRALLSDLGPVVGIEFPGWEWGTGPWQDVWPQGGGDAVSALFFPPNPVGVREVGRGVDRTPGPVEGSSPDVSQGKHILFIYTTRWFPHFIKSQHSWCAKCKVDACNKAN